MFLRHEGILGALGASMSYEKHDDLRIHHLVERFPMGAPYVWQKDSWSSSWRPQ
jgi:bifunctional damage-control phosphatase, subfamily II, fusion protein